MNKLKLLIVFFTSISISIFAQNKEMEILLSEAMLKEASINVKLINSIDYTPNGFLLLASSNQFYMLGIGSMPPVLKKTKQGIDAFTVTQDSTLLAIGDNTLYRMDTTGILSAMFNLPIAKAGIVSGNNDVVAYIFDRTLQKGKKEYAVYQISDNVEYTRLLSTPTPITSAFEYKTSLLVSTENKILCADSKTKTFFELYSLPQNKDKIISITGDGINHAFYFSTSDTIYRIMDSKLEYICTDFGGTLKYDGEGLLVFNPEKSLIVRFRNNLLYPLEIKKRLIPEIDKANYLSDEQLKKLSIPEIRKLVLQKRIGEAASGYSHLVAKDSLNTNLLAEYSYTLALNGAYDCALMNLDRVRLVAPTSSEGQFYTALVFSLMGYDNLYMDFIKNIPGAKIPEWISLDKHSDLLSVYRQSPQLNKDDYPTALKRVNYLAASALYLQSIALYEEIIRDYPSEYLPHVGYSIVLEKINFYRQAADEMKTAVKMMADNPKLLEAKNVFEKRVADLNDKINSPQNVKNKFQKLKNEFNPQTMLYAGGMISKDYVSVNSRFGVYLNNSFNGAIDLGVGGNAGNISTNLGLSAYKRFGIFVWGEGLNVQIADSGVFSLKSSAGLSFINRNRNSSFDIFLDVYLPLTGGKTSYGISIGKSIYFGNR